MKAVLFSLFSLDYKRAIKLLPSSNFLIPILQNPQNSDANVSESLKKSAKSESDPYAKCCLWFISGPLCYKKILKKLSIIESLTFSLYFHNDADLKSELKNLIEIGKTEGILDTLILTGFNQDSPTILSKFYENSEDLQTVAILSIYIQQYIKSELLESYVSAYKYELNRMELYNSRCLLEIEESKMLNKKKPRNKCIRCYFCGSSILIGDILGGQNIAKRGDPQSISKPFLNHCPACPNTLPKCCVCLNNLKSINPYFNNEKIKLQDNFIELFTWCEKCHHGGHASHIIEWFNEMNECPVYGCECTCNNLDNI